ncbi:glycoside hydrolase family 127 protein [Roseateles sp. LYH14W]|uniref:Beta-L-arabinofuranosidase domain-containing protein n=1 Tax=Pelomonas parva TaxID=3299032 RepID=A0ABW7F8J7_9BURK
MNTRRDFLASAGVAPLLAAMAPGAQAGESAGRSTGAGAFPLSSVRLLPGPFEAARVLGATYLLSLNADRLLHGFRTNAGLAPKAPRYGGWESQELCPGHTLGHYLSACSLMSASTGREDFRQRVNHVVDELHNCQQAARSGLVCAFPDGDAQLQNALAGRPVTGVPWYTMHKIMAGLHDAHVHAAHPQALPVLARLADWMVDVTERLDEQQFQKMLDLEHGGMNEVLANLHALTADARYLRLAQRFNHRALLDPLAEGRDTLDGLHSNTQIPKVIGFARLAQTTGDERLVRAARYFWGSVVEKRSFATGGNGDGEHFFPVEETRKHVSSGRTMETCCTYNMLRLTRSLFGAAPSAAYADYHELALFNGILASQDPDSGMSTYFQPAGPSRPKLYGSPERAFWCCTGTGMESFAKLGDSIYFHDAQALYVNLFVSSSLDWREQQVRLRQTTAFPDEARTRLSVHPARPTRLALRLRHPGWCPRLTVRLNGRPLLDSTDPGRYVEIDRLWRDGDVLDVDLPMPLRMQPLPRAPDVAAVIVGPIVLAARLGAQGIAPGDDVGPDNGFWGHRLESKAPLPRLALHGRALEEVVRPVGAPLSFRARSAAGQEISLAPFHRIAHERYSLYWQVA